MQNFNCDVTEANALLAAANIYANKINICKKQNYRVVKSTKQSKNRSKRKVLLKVDKCNTVGINQCF